MARNATKHSRDQAQAQDYQGLLNNLQDWELSLKEKDKKLKSDTSGKGKLDRLGQKQGNVETQISEGSRVNGKQALGKNPLSDNTSGQYDYLKEYVSLSQLSSGVRSQDSFVDAISEKELGNQFFKEKKFNEAVDCYSRSIALSPTAVAFANRAMAYIKLKRFQEAERDCTEALNLDDRYLKAYSRRSTARKELGKLEESIDDAEFALSLEPQNQELKKQCEESKSLLKKEILKKVSGRAQPGKSNVEKNKNQPKLQLVASSSSGIVANVLEDHHLGNNTREVTAETAVDMERSSRESSISDADNCAGTTQRKLKDKNQKLMASVQELATKAAKAAKAEAARTIVPPTSAYQFEVSWRGLSGDRDLQACLLKVTSPTALPMMFKNALSASMLVDIIRCIGTFFMEDMALGVEYLQNLTKIPRFNMIIMLLSSADKADVTKIWNEVFNLCSTDYADILSDLRPRYGIKQ